MSEPETEDLVILSLTGNIARCRSVSSNENLSLRTSRLSELAPGFIATVEPVKRWTYGRHVYLSGPVLSTRIDVPALALAPLRLTRHGIWDPAEEYLGEPGEPLEDHVRQAIAWGPRPDIEMEQVLPGNDPDDPGSDPIIRAIELKDAGDYHSAADVLMDLCQQDLRCLDAHAHLGNLSFDTRPKDAIRYYEMGVRIGEAALGGQFDGVLRWAWGNNRPFLRCLNGYGLCLWRMGRFAEAAEVFGRMLWLNPADNQGIRGVVEDVRAGEPWVDE